MKHSAPAKFRTLRWLALLGLVSISCIHTPPETLVGVDLSLGEAHQTSYGCDEEVLSRQTHRQWSSGAALRHRWSNGVHLVGRARRLVGEVTDVRGLEPEEGPGRQYTLWSAGLMAGFSAPWGGLEGGGTWIEGLGDGPPWPWLNAWVGGDEGVRLEVGAGASDPLFVASVLHVGVGFGTERVDGRVVAATYGHLLEKMVEGQTGLGLGAHDQYLDVGVLADVTIDLGQVRLDLGAVLGQGFAGRVGLLFVLP